MIKPAGPAAGPLGGEKSTITNGKLHGPDQPIIPFIRARYPGRDICARACGCSTQRSIRPMAASASSF